jgi:glycosyltransferase involved in cell wall biosynthesis
VPYPRYKKKFNKNKLKIMYIGRFQLDHNIKIILKSAKYILYEKKIHNISFDLYGYGEDLDYIKKYKFENNLTNLKLKGKAKKNSINSISKKYDLALCTVSGSKIFQWGINLNKIYEYLNSSMPVIFSGKVPCNPVVKARCGFVCGSYNYIHLSKKIIIFNKLENNKKRKLSINAKNFFDVHYNIKIQIKKLDFFLKSL